MSGPKVSIYSVAPYIRENVRAQQRLLRKRLSLQKQILTKISSMNTILENCGNFIHTFDNTVQSLSDSCNELTARLTEAKNIATVQFAGIDKINGMPEKYRYFPELVTRYQVIIQQLQEIVDSCTVILDKADMTFTNLEKQKQRQMDHDAGKALSNLNDFDFDSIAVSSHKLDTRLRDHTVEQLRKLVSDPVLSDKLRKKAETAIFTLMQMNNESLISNYASITCKTIMTNAEEERKAYHTDFEEYQKNIDDYHAVCQEAGYEPDNIPYSSNWQDNVQEAVDNILIHTERQAETGYINECLDDVMTQMGYEVIGRRDVTKKSGRKFPMSFR